MNLWKHPHAIRFLFVLTTIGFLSCNDGADFHSGAADKFVTKSAVENFRAANTEPQSYNFRFEQDTVKQEITLQMKGSRSIETEQINREQRFETFRQGHSGDSQAESFSVNELGKLDLLLIIDDSNSMTDYQKLLAPGLDTLLTHISNAAWQIGVITTTSACLRGGALLTSAEYAQDPDAVRTAFNLAVNAGVNGSTFEKGILRAAEGLRGNCGDPDQKWLRQDSHVAILILSDERNCGSATNEGCPGEAYEKADYLLNAQNYVDGMQFFGILHKDEFADCPYYGLPGPTEYERLIRETSPTPATAAAGNICQSDYTDILERISSEITMQPRYRYELLYRPVPSTVEVKLDGQPLVRGRDFVVNGSSLRVKRDIATTDDRLEVSYDHSPQPINDSFDLQLSADPTTVSVTIDDDMVDPDSYVIEGDRLRFKQPPAERSSIRISYREMTELPASFEVAESVVPETIEAWVEDQPVQQFAVSGNKVVFESAPRDGQKVKFRYHVEEDRITSYQIPAIEMADVESMQLVDLESFEAIEASLVDGHINIDPQAVLPGKKALATYFIKPSDDPLVLRFDEAIADGTVQMESSNEECSQDADIQEHAILFSCSASEIDQIEINYDKIISLANTFEVVTAFGDDHTEWVVKVDGKETTNFSVSGNTVTVDPSVLTDQSEVEILVRWREPSN